MVDFVFGVRASVVVQIFKMEFVGFVILTLVFNNHLTILQIFPTIHLRPIIRTTIVIVRDVEIRLIRHGLIVNGVLVRGVDDIFSMDFVRCVL